MDAAFAKIEFKSLMVKIRYLSETADAELARTMHRELERELGVLTPKLRISKNSIVISEKEFLKQATRGTV